MLKIIRFSIASSVFGDEKLLTDSCGYLHALQGGKRLELSESYDKNGMTNSEEKVSFVWVTILYCITVSETQTPLMAREEKNRDQETINDVVGSTRASVDSWVRRLNLNPKEVRVIISAKCLNLNQQVEWDNKFVTS